MNICSHDRIWIAFCVVAMMGLPGCGSSPPRDGAAVLVGSAAVPAPATPATVLAAPAADSLPNASVSVANAALSAQDVQRALGVALEALQAGQEDQAEQELRKILQQDANHRLALSLLRQIKEDPQAMLGRESFAYRVLPGETLSRIAQRFMNDLHLFYALARYNGIKVPRALAGGQLIRVPGKAPAASSLVPATAPRPVTATPAAEGRPSAAPPEGVVEATVETAEAKLSKQKADNVARQTRVARSALAKQDLDAAIRAWDAVLEIDPNNRTAVLERQKVVGMKEKLGKVK